MVYKCSVPKCRGNYANGPKVSIFSLPKDKGLMKQWINAIPRENIIPNNNFRVCELHFKPSEILKESQYFDSKSGQLLTAPLSVPKLKEGAIPSIYPGCPFYLTKQESEREPPQKRAERKESALIDKAIQLSKNNFLEYQASTSYETIQELAVKMDKFKFPDALTIIKKDSSILFVKIDSPPIPNLSLSIVVDSNLMVSAFYNKVPIVHYNSFTFPSKVNNIHELILILEQLLNFNGDEYDKVKNFKSLITSSFHELKKIVTENNQDMLDFLNEQVNLISVDKTSLRYSADLLVLSSLLHSISPHSYKFLRNSSKLILPHPNTLKKFTSSYNLDPRVQTIDNNFLKYAEDKFKYLKDGDKVVNLMMDEIHLKPFLDFKGGDIIGASYNSGKAANSAFVFMIQSLKSTFKDVVHILPVKTITAELLYDVILQIVKKLESIGYFVIVISSDNNAINKKAISMFANPPKLSICYLHPISSDRPLFYVIDPVHLLKSIRNNWLNQKNPDIAMYYPTFNPTNVSGSNIIDQTASFTALKKLYELEKDGLVKYAYSLTAKSLCPSNIERQNVSLALNVFNVNVAESLNLVKDIHKIQNAAGTADFIKLVVNWFDVMNVKSKFKGYHKRNVYQQPLTCNENDEGFYFLHNFLNWLEKWGSVKMQTGRFTRETLQALNQTTNAVIQIAKYCIEELNFEFILTGKLQTDALESRFGKYRQLAGSHYNISLTQVYEIEKKVRLQSILPLAIKSNNQGEILLALEENDSIIQPSTNFPSELNKIYVTKYDIKNLNLKLPAIVFVSGYCVHSILKKLNCIECKRNLLLEKDIIVDDDSFSLIKSLDRGGLKYPIDSVTTIVIYNYVVISKLLSQKYESIFLKVFSKRAVACKITINELNATENYLNFETCVNNHTSEHLLNEVCKKSTNIFLKNYCKKVNDDFSFAALQSKKRKLMTLNPV